MPYSRRKILVPERRMPNASRKDIWDKIQVVAALTASLLVPLAVAFVGSMYANAMKDAENRIKYVELAASILRTDPTAENAPLRLWAIEVLDRHSTVPLTQDAKVQLQERKVGIIELSDEEAANANFGSFKNPTVKTIQLDCEHENKTCSKKSK